jgi:pseudaminic acid synthase
MNMEIAGIKIGLRERPYVVAELSGNHNQSLELALSIVEAAAWAGVDAVKLQTYTADTITMDHSSPEFFVSEASALWKGEKLYDLFHKAHTPWDWHEPLMRKAKDLGLACFSSAFDETSVDFLESLGAPAYKIASYECVDIPLIQRVARTNKPVIISTGMASIGEIDDAVKAVREAGNSSVALLKCTSSYPAKAENSNLVTIAHMRSQFNLEVGISDHTLGIGAAVVSIAMGSTIVEKHITLSRKDGGVDAAFSLEPTEMKALVEEVNAAWLALGTIHYGPTMVEMNSVGSRRSLYFVADVEEGERISGSNVRSIRPGLGLPPKYLSVLLGKKVNRRVARGTPLSWDLFG